MLYIGAKQKIPKMFLLSTFFLISAAILSICLLVFIFYSTVIGFVMGAPFARSGRKEIQTMLNLADVKSGELVVDLGSGDGSILIEAGKRGTRAVGIEINPFLVCFSRLRVKLSGLSGRVAVKFGDFRKYSLKDADAVFFYLLPDTVNNLQEKLARELKPNCRIISKHVPLNGRKPERKKDNIFLYICR